MPYDGSKFATKTICNEIGESVRRNIIIKVASIHCKYTSREYVNVPVILCSTKLVTQSITSDSTIRNEFSPIGTL